MSVNCLGGDKLSWSVDAMTCCLGISVINTSWFCLYVPEILQASFISSFRKTNDVYTGPLQTTSEGQTICNCSLHWWMSPAIPAGRGETDHSVISSAGISSQDNLLNNTSLLAEDQPIYDKPSWGWHNTRNRIITGNTSVITETLQSGQQTNSTFDTQAKGLTLPKRTKIVLKPNRWDKEVTEVL